MTVLTGFPLFLAIVAIPERYQIVDKTSSLNAGLRLMPFLVASALGSTLNGVISVKRNLNFYGLLTASCLMILGSGLMSSVSDNSGQDVKLYGYQVLFGFGLGATLSGTAIEAAINSNFEDYCECL